ncbi:hypothetical protein AAG570_005705 [Ranatra chinensis]|uniref:Uncharacterized protein n=1 Tax=Ranatra chinensis TaxID=642074 RepID=A0ABD0YLR7_9HEMI
MRVWVCGAADAFKSCVRSETELVWKESTNGTDDSLFQASLAQLLKEKGNGHQSETSRNKVASRCLAVLTLCNGLNLGTSELTSADIETLHRIIQVARSITEDDMTAGDKKETGGLLEAQTTSLVLQVSRTLASMEQRLLVGDKGRQLALHQI